MLLDAGRDVDLDGLLGAHAPVALTLGARLADHGALSRATRARRHGDELAEHRAGGAAHLAVPPHVAHVVGRAPSWAPVPPHAVQRSKVRRRTVFAAPFATSSSVSSSVTLTSCPRWRSRRARSPPPKKASNPPRPPKSRMKMLSASERSKCAKPNPPPAAPAPRTPATPYRSYAARFSGSRSTSYASVISLNFSSAAVFSAAATRSGWYFMARPRYAFLISASPASRATPSRA